jgi:hypothetical protein
MRVERIEENWVNISDVDLREHHDAQAMLRDTQLDFAERYLYDHDDIARVTAHGQVVVLDRHTAMMRIVLISETDLPFDEAWPEDND